MRWILCVLVVAMMGAGAATKPAPAIHSCKQIIEEIPKDQKPEPGADWDGIGRELAQKWVKKNIPDRQFDGKIIYSQSQVIYDDDKNPKYVEAYFSDDSTKTDRIETGSSITCRFSKSMIDYFRKAKRDKVMVVKGKISEAQFGGGGKVSIELTIVDAEIAK